MTAAEITFTVPDALEVIRQVRRELGDAVVLGAGTVLDPETARAALLAGAEFIVAPTVNLEVIRLCRRYDKVVMPGAFTPTEVLTAWEAGADVVKIFPADLGGPPYLKALRGPLPQVRLMPTGGVDLDTAEAFLKAGACCLGVGARSSSPRPSPPATSPASATSPRSTRPSSGGSAGRPDPALQASCRPSCPPLAALPPLPLAQLGGYHRYILGSSGWRWASSSDLLGMRSGASTGLH